MELKQKLRNPFIQQYLVEIIFPLIGYFFFDWDILIIGVYYLIDHLCSQIMFFRRAFMVNKKGTAHGNLIYFYLAIVLFVILFSTETLGFGYFVSEASGKSSDTILNEVLQFAKDELWLLFPVVLFMYHLKDQFTFYMPRHYLKHQYSKMLLWDGISTLTILLLFFAGGILWIKTLLPDLAIIAIFLVIKIAFDLSLKRFFIRKTFL